MHLSSCRSTLGIAIILTLAVASMLLAGPAIAGQKGSLHLKKKARSKAMTQKPGLPDIVAVTSKYKMTLNGSTLNFEVVFRNNGDGPAGCFNWLLADSRSGIKMGDVCKNKPRNWQLRPGQEVMISGTIGRSELWVWPDERGYMSKVRFNANHGSKIPEKSITNNHTQFKVIYWDQKIVQNAF